MDLYKDPVSIDGETGPENLIQGKISMQVFLTLRSKIQTDPVTDPVTPLMTFSSDPD